MRVIEEKFKSYYEEFDTSDKNIERKYYHSLRVMYLSELIAKDLHVSDIDLRLAKIIGLLHDYGRFPQWRDYRTYDDRFSLDHGNLGAEILFDDLEIKDYIKNQEYFDEIYDAIKYHNKYKIKDTLSPHNTLLCKIVRDADKLDILYLYSSKEIPNKLYYSDNSEISNEIEECFKNEKSIHSSLVVTNNDYILYVLAFVFDINFKYSFNHLIRYNIINKLYDEIENNYNLKKYFDIVNNYINRKAEE